MAGAKFNLKFLLDATDHASSVFGKVEGRGKRMGKALAGVGGALTAGITAPVLAAGFASAKFAIDFEKSMANISTLIDTDTESLSGLSDAVLATSRKLKGAVALNELPTALYEIRSAGVSATDQLMVLERSAKLGAAGLGTTNEAVDLVTSSLNAFELKGKAAERVYDNIFATVNLGKTTISGLAQGFGATAGTVAAAGIELDEYLSSVAALTTTGQPASQAHTQLKAVVSGLTRETKQSKAVFKELGGKDLPSLIKQYGGLVPVMNKISDYYEGDSAKILNLVGSTEALNAVLSLTGAQSKAQADALALMRSESELLDEAFEKQAATTSARMRRMSNRFQEMGIKLGNALLPTLEKIAAKVEKVIDWFDKLSSSDKQLAAWGIAAAAALGPVLLVAGKLVSAFSAISSASALKKLAGAAGGKAGAALGQCCCCGPQIPTGGGGGADVAGKAAKGRVAQLAARAAPVALAVGGAVASVAALTYASQQIGDKYAEMGQQRRISDAHEKSSPLAFSGVENAQGINNYLGITPGAETQPLQLSPEFLKKAGVAIDADSARAIGEATAQAQAQNPIKTEVMIDVRNLPAGAQVRATSTADTTETRVGRATEGS